LPDRRLRIAQGRSSNNARALAYPGYWDGAKVIAAGGENDVLLGARRRSGRRGCRGMQK